MRNKISKSGRPHLLANLIVAMLGCVAGALPTHGAVYAWGYNGYGQTNVPADLGDVVAVSGGGGHSLALRWSGTVAAWGDNTYHQTNVPAGLSNVIAVSAGTSHSLALRADGAVVGWGDNSAGQINPPADLAGVVAIATGGSHSLALKTDGTVEGWGANSSGQTSVPSDLNNVVAIASGGSHSLALKADGTVVAWGENFYGQTNVPVGLSNVVAIQAGSSHSLALTTGGAVVAWGLNAWGQGEVPPGLQAVSGIAAGAAHNLALLRDGTVFGWGLNYDGETEVPPGLTNVSSVEAGDFHSLALLGEGAPFPTTPLLGRKVPLGGTSIFYVKAAGATPLSYQWVYNGTNLAGATQSMLVLTNVQASDAGVYQLEVRNSYGLARTSKASLVVVENGGCPTVLPGMLAWWAGENDGHDKVSGNEALPTAGVSFGVGEVGNCFEFHGTNQHLVVADAPALNPTYGFTVEAWIYPTQAPHVWATILSKSDGSPVSQYELHVIKASETQAVLYGVIATSDGVKWIQGTNEISVNAWTHVAMTYDLTNLSLYVNGRLDVSQTGIASMVTTQAPLYIGGGHYFLFDGRIDELSIYGRALTPWELQWIYNAGSLGKCSTTFPPVIQMQPTNQTVLAGSTAWLGGLVSGTEPFFYQWYFNGNSIPGARGESLLLTNIQPSQAGSYYFAVSNIYGAAISRVAEVAVLSSPSIVEAVGGAFDSGGIVTVPVELVAVGNENALAFTFNFSPDTLRYLDVRPGKDTGTVTLMINTNEVTGGSLGIGLAMPMGRAFPPGTQQLASVSFMAPTVETQSITFITFSDSLAKRQVADTAGAVLPSAFLGGTIVISPAGFEGDVMPRPHGEGEVTAADWAQLGRYVARLDVPANFAEFRRADCAPRGTLGDGIIGLADWVQAGRYVIGLDPLTIAGGPGVPTASSAPALLSRASKPAPKTLSRRLGASQVTVGPNTTATMSVTLQSEGNESAVAFSLSFDPAALQYEGAAPGKHAAQAQLNINAKEATAGRLAFALAFPPGPRSFEPGLQELVQLTFQPTTRAAGVYPVQLTDQPVLREVCDSACSALAASYQPGTITVETQPRLRFARAAAGLTLSWPLWATNAALQQSADPSLRAETWMRAPGSPVITNGEWSITLPQTNTLQFYRLNDH